MLLGSAIQGHAYRYPFRAVLPTSVVAPVPCSKYVEARMGGF